MATYLAGMLRAHPRAGGDGWPVSGSTVAVGGSPPRRRGRLVDDRRCPVRVGLTPAQAGTARDRGAGAGWAGAHPRAGGDGRIRAGLEVGRLGSPPRKRGRRAGFGGHGVAVGLTPAQAGTAHPGYAR